MSQSDKNVPSEPKETGTLPRIRTTSECSYTSDDGTSGFTEKRQRTTSQQFMVTSGLTAASPPKFVSLEEIMQAANGMRDMALVHQIVVDEDFKLKRAEPPPNSIQKMIKETMHKAFWDVLREQLAEDPPNYAQAFNLLEEIKQGLFAVLLPQHTRIKQQISEILDSELIKQQAEKGTLDFKHYAQYVISVMSKLCAPVRDDRIKELTETEDVIDTFKGILETLDLMQLDMANFTLQMARPDIIACSVDLERKKFADFLSIQNDGLEHTRKWLLKHVNTSEPVPADVEYEKFIRNILKKGFLQSCVDLLDWEEDAQYPETFMLDEERLIDLKMRTFRLISVATVLLVTISNAGADLQSIAPFKDSLKEHISILLQSVKNDKDLNETLPNVAEQVVNDLKEAQQKYELPEMFQAAEANLKQQILDIGKPDHKVKAIVKQRVKDFFLDIIESSTAAPQKVPSGLTALQKELTETAGQFLRIVSHNSTVFCIYYYDIIAAALPKGTATG
ncbi:T-complex protein 11-like protein 1 [Anoplophora glabripennis]|uniref:T-complex protein-like protein n=1 Tax=Anoplophora glabripennis TaxID=217634 RepID=V5IA69_ANOGL|nr:T-complex protein 11-like protein 1 [Anoplophora glabripennis]